MSVCEQSAHERIVDIRRQVVDALLEIDHIELQANPQILAKYAQTIGCLESELCRWQLQARRCKRKFSLAQSAVNCGEPVVLEAIERTLDEEFTAWEKQLAVRASKQLELLETIAQSRPLSPLESQEIKALHKALIKRLHPDLHADLPEEASRFFLIAQRAYESGDIETLRAVCIATEEHESTEEGQNRAECEQEIDLALAEAQLSIARERIDSLKGSHPYLYLELLENPIALSQRKTSLRREIEQQKKVVRLYEEKVADLKAGETQWPIKS